MRLAAESTALIPERSTDPLEHVDYRLATTPEEKDKIYRLRYRAYLREGAILPSASERVIDQHDDAPNSWTFGIYIHGELYSSLRVTLLTSDCRSSPSYEIFDEILDPELDRGRIIVAPPRFVADLVLVWRFPVLPYVTVRQGWLACGYFNADLGLASVRPEHRAFYRKVFLQEPLGEPRIYSGLLKPVGLMAAHYPAIREKVFQRFPYMRSSAFERRMLFERKNAAHADAVVSPFERTSIVPQQS